jgi:predicted nucleic acid-binding protein
MTAADAFFDTNVLLYLISADARKATRAEQLLAGGGVVSVQVLNEFADVAQRKYGNPWPRVRAVLSDIRALCRVEANSVQTHEVGLRIAERYKFRVYDGMIVAAAILSGCRRLLSEDMQDGQKIDQVTIRNPFIAH